MALTIYENFPLSVKDVVSHEIIPFSRKVINVVLAQDVQPGSVIDATTGGLVTSDSMSAFVVLEYKSASETAQAVLVGGSNLWYKDFNLVATDVNKAIELLSVDPTIRFSYTNESGIPTT